MSPVSRNVAVEFRLRAFNLVLSNEAQRGFHRLDHVLVCRSSGDQRLRRGLVSNSVVGSRGFPDGPTIVWAEQHPENRAAATKQIIPTDLAI
jgi:hypothetical protein